MAIFSNLKALQMLLLFFLSCSVNNAELNCDSISSNQSVFVIGREKNKVDYQIDNRLTDISNSLGIENWGPDRIKRYAFSSDTLTLIWYYAYGMYNNETPYKLINRTIILDSINFTDQKYETIKFKNLYGVLSTLKCKNNDILLFYGLNETSDIMLEIKLKALKIDDNAIKAFMCMLKSFQFSPQKE